jgi:isochorismate synthase
MDILTSVSSSKISETELLSFLTEHATANEFPFAVWKLPHSPVKQVLISHQVEKLSRDAVLEDLVTGFIFAPFDRSKQSIFLPANFLFSFENGELKESINPIEATSAQWLEKNFQTNPSSAKAKFHRISSPPTAEKQADLNFINLVNLCMDEVEKGTFEKIVPSRTKHISLPADFDIVNAFQKLCARYPNAMISFVSIPGVGNWLGATPEVLVSVNDKNIFKTVALAGTQPYTEGMNLKSVAWTQKEIEEQALVERYIISCFKKIRLREYDEHGPKTVVAGNLIHLKSDFQVDMKATGFPQLGTLMLQLLHPTSAVCGMPLDISLEFLKKHEGYDRAYYSGFLGPVNVNNNIDIFVNLRCMQLLDREAILYAGAGITIDSIPEEEFEETEMKFNTLLNVILS